MRSTHTLAVSVCALALLLGVAVADDYGIWTDTYQQRAIGEATLRHLAGESGLNLLWPPWDRLYGPIFETLLALVERILGRDDSRQVMFSRHLLTHLFFVAAGFVGYLLALRLFGSRWLALFALLLFLLHPRIYAHSFFNSKDVPFLSLFMICLWLAHRAFGRDSSDSAAPTGDGKGAIRAFALCGIAAGLLTNLRTVGLVFVALVVFMRLCDAIGADTRKRAIASSAVFAVTAAATYYATMPYLWADPLTRFMEVLEFSSAHPMNRQQLFQGKQMPGSDLPPSFLPVWFGITTPPLALLLGAVGLAALVCRFAPRPFASLSRNTLLRFELLIGACLLLPVLAAMVLRPTLNDHWRQFYFLWAPFVLLATSGLRTLALGVGRLSSLLPIAAAGLATLGLAATAVEMARLSPHQHLYFNVLANRPGTTTPVHKRFDSRARFSAQHGWAHVLEELADPRRTSGAGLDIHLQAQRKRVFSLHESTGGQRHYARLGIAKPYGGFELFSERDQRRLSFDRNADADFYVIRQRTFDGGLFPPKLYERRLYGKPIVQVATPDLSRVDEATAQSYRALYRQVTSGAPVFSGAGVDVYRGEAAIFWVRESCPPGGVNDRKAMVVVPLDAAGAAQRYVGSSAGVRVGNACLWRALLPDAPVAKMLFPGFGALASDAYLEEHLRRYARLEAALPAARSVFDVYLEGGTLFYVKSPCVREDAEPAFFVHVRPRDVGDLSRPRRRHGFDVLDFRFAGADVQGQAIGDIFDAVCLARLELPDYPVASIATGQRAASGADLWRVEMAVADG